MRAHIAAAEAADHIALMGEQNPGAVSVPGVRQQAGASSPGASACTTLTIPAPPSVNNLFSNSVRGRFKTPKYKAWLQEAGWRIREQMAADGCDRVPGRVVVMIGVERTNLRADLDNQAKAVLDLLTAHHVIDDDRFVTGLVLAWMPQGGHRTPIARVMIRPAEPITLNFHPHTDGATGGWFIDAPDEDGEV
jgi:crossover junction endodeoxyribonuclease RusA